jgi:FkbM family methyltransferase
MNLLRAVNSYLPFKVAVAGRKRDALFTVFDTFCLRAARRDIIQTPFGPIALDAAHAPERWLSYAYVNIFNYYRTSELGRYMATLPQRGSTFIDVGANLGMYALVAKSLGFRALLVEPEPRHAAFLQRNAGTFGKVISVALADRSGTLPLYYEEGNSGATSLVPAQGYTRGEIGVPVRTFSDLVGAGELSQPEDISLIKVDVEGAESEMVSGMRGFLNGGYRPAIWCEVRGDKSGRAPGSCRQVSAFLAEFDYRAVELVHGRRRSANPVEFRNRAVFDLLFEHPPSSV